MPCAFVVFFKPIGYGGGPSDFDASREQKRAARIPKHGFYIAHIMCILCGHEFSEESPCFGYGGGPSDFDASREQKRAARIPKHGFYIAHIMCILCGHEFSEESPCFG